VKKFIACTKKNFKNIFRNWTSLFLIIIGPLILLGIIFAAFSDLGFSNINIGYVAPDDDKISTFMSSINYVGNFEKYSDIAVCNEELKTQKLHTCLDIKQADGAVAIDMHVDNTRTLISYILFGQIRQAVVQERQKIIQETVGKSIRDAQNAEDFLTSAKVSIDEALDEIENQQENLEKLKSEMNRVDNSIDTRISDLNNHRFQLAAEKSTIASEIGGLYDQSQRTLRDASTLIGQIYDAGTSPNAPSEAYVQSVLNQGILNTDARYRDFQTDLIDVSTVINGIDRVVDDLETAQGFLSTAKSKIGDVERSVDAKESELRELRSDINYYKTQIGAIGNLNANSFAAPLEVSLVPLFTGSKRLSELRSDADLTQGQKARLLNFGSLQTLVPFILSVMICFISIILGNIVVLDEMHSPAFLRNTIAPVSNFTKTAAIFVTVFAITSVQVSIVLGISAIVFFLDIFSNFLGVIIPLFFLIAIYSAVGMIIGYLIRSQTTGLLVSSFVLLTNLFLSGVVYPVERMAPFMEILANAIPFTSGISMLQQGIFYGTTLRNLLPQLLQLIVIFIGVLVILGLTNKLSIYMALKEG